MYHILIISAFSASSLSPCAPLFKKLLLNTTDMPLLLITHPTREDMDMEPMEPMELMEDTVLDLLMLDIMEREKLDSDQPKATEYVFFEFVYERSEMNIQFL